MRYWYWVTLVSHSSSHRYFVSNVSKLKLMIHISSLYLRWSALSCQGPFLCIEPWTTFRQSLSRILFLLYFRKHQFLSLLSDPIHCVLKFFLYAVCALNSWLQFCSLFLYHVNCTFYYIFSGFTITKNLHLPDNFFFFSHIFRVLLDDIWFICVLSLVI